MSAIDPQIACQLQNLDPSVKPRKQKKWSYNVVNAKIIVAEAERFFQDDFIRVVKYPKWLTNVVVVPKKNGKW